MGWSVAERSRASTAVVLREARRRVAELPGPVEAPTVALGVFERVGSNWFLDLARPAGQVHNEPFRQQLHATHPLSALNPHLVDVVRLGADELGPYGLHWLVSFVASKYGTPAHVVKETNLFFAVGNLLRLFPDAPVVVLARSPVGIASSFARGGLFDRWHYADRYAQLQAMARRPEFTGYRVVLPDGHPTRLVMLTRLIVLNALLLADAVAPRPFRYVPYEHALARHPTAPPAATGPSLDSTFSTRAGSGQLHLDRGEVDAVRREVDARLADAERDLPAGPVRLARHWLAPGLDGPAARWPAAAPPPAARPAPSPPVTPRFIAPAAGAAVAWRDMLVTNYEFCRFLNEMASVGARNVAAGAPLFCLDAMPEARGGRILPVPGGGHRVALGYGNHPAYWVTWLGAAAFARWAGARLPTRAELDQLATTEPVDFDAINADYRTGDATAVNADPPVASIHHLVGSVQAWCADGPPSDGGPLARYLYGAAWNTPATWVEVRRVRARHITGTSRGVGIRLVCDAATPANPEPAAQIAQRLHHALHQLADRTKPLAHLDHQLVAALAPDA